jgi:hypothetical protein
MDVPSELKDIYETSSRVKSYFIIGKKSPAGDDHEIPPFKERRVETLVAI